MSDELGFLEARVLLDQFFLAVAGKNQEADGRSSRQVEKRQALSRPAYF